MKILWKKCTECGEPKTLENFQGSKAGKFGVESWCKSCKLKRARMSYYANAEKYSEKARVWRENNPEKSRAISRKWKSTNPEKVKTKGRQWREHNPNYSATSSRKWRIMNPERNKTLKTEWNRKNPEKVCEYSHRKRAKTHNAEGSYTSQEWFALCAKYDNKCLCCGRSDVLLTVDHVIPFDSGGTNWIWNLQPLCGSCNSIKALKTDDYRYSHRFDVLEVKRGNQMDKMAFSMAQ